MSERRCAVAKSGGGGRAVGNVGDGVDDPVSPVVDGDLQAGFRPGGDQLVEDVLDPLLEGHQSSPRSTAWPESASKGTDACS
jgi:hypothetical protein